MEKIKKSFRGYNKKAVHALLEKMSEQHECDRVAFSEENGRLKDELSRAKTEIAELTEKVEALSVDKEYVAKAIVNAEKEAAKIIAMAHVKAQEVSEESARLVKAERDQARMIRESVLSVMRDYQSKIDAITPAGDNE